MSGETSSLSGGVEEAPAPRLCHLIKWPDFDGYGFNLHAERSNPGQFIGKIDAESPAQMAGLREGDRIIEVNGVNIANENHRQVVERIKALENEARLLVVDAEADLWYRERELVVKASQMNVIYIKTPVPRPAPDSPRSKARVDSSRPPAATAAARSSSEPAGEQQQDGGAPASGDAPAAAGEQNGEQQKGDERASEAPEQQQQQEASSLTSDFNEDSIEPQPARHEQQPSGVLTVEAEINRQTAAAHVDEAARSRKQQLVEEVKRQVGGARRARETAAEEAAEVAVGAGAKTNDAKTNEEEKQQQIEPDSLQPEGATIDAKERARQVHNRSADSGKSSSRDTATSGAESDNTGSHSSLAVDSLEGELAAAQPQLAPAPGRKESGGGGAVESGGKQPPASSVAPATPEVAAAAAAAEHGGPGKAHRAAGPQDSTDSAGSAGSISGHNNNNNIDRGENHVTYAKAPPQEQEQQQATSPTSTTNSTTAGGAAVAPAGQPQQQQQQLSNNNNNNKAGGCLISNLNMTASQMRELIASRKKIDPKKAQMNIRQKYEIIQQM